ncbi:hypothetical protein N657DRAFT_535463, partial [Parathielavia appendiculata]
SLQLRCQSGQGEQLHSFVDAMARTIREHSTSYRKRYPERYEPARSDEIILDDATVRKITPMVSRWCSSMSFWEKGATPIPVNIPPGGVCPHNAHGSLGLCQCPIPHEERKGHAFYRQKEYNSCFDFEDHNGRSFYNLELVKTLLLYGEMGIILRVCASPEVDLRTWQTNGNCQCLGDDAGWDLIYKTALLPYMAFNLIHFFPETWDLKSGRTDENDYRQMSGYLYMLKKFNEAKKTTSELAAYPHWQFFGINQREDGYVIKPDVQPQNQKDRGVYPSGTGQILRDRGVPAELVAEIMETAEFGPTTARLEVQHHPFHRFNEEELAKYVEYCWQLLVRCDMMATALGLDMNWNEMI